MEVFSEYTMVECSRSDLRDLLTIVIKLPAGARIDGVVYGVVGEESTLETKIHNAKELLDP